MGYTDRYKKVIRVYMQVRRGRESVGDAMYYADDMMMGCRGEKKKRVTNIVYEINQDNNRTQKSQETENGGLVSSLTFHGIFTFFWGK